VSVPPHDVDGKGYDTVVDDENDDGVCDVRLHSDNRITSTRLVHRLWPPVDDFIGFVRCGWSSVVNILFCIKSFYVSVFLPFFSVRSTTPVA
jgi:hypothetical protein